MSSEIPYIPIVTILGFGALITIVWNVSKKYSTEQTARSALETRHNEDVDHLKAKIADLKEELIEESKNREIKIEQAKAERKEEIKQASDSTGYKIDGVQEQINSLRSDVKDMGSRITVVDTKVKGQENTLTELKRCDERNSDFFREMIHRVENRVQTEVEFSRRTLVDFFTRRNKNGDNQSQ